jgi:hypothetical protein
MLKKAKMTFFFAAVIAIVTLFAVTGIEAKDECLSNELLPGINVSYDGKTPYGNGCIFGWTIYGNKLSDLTSVATSISKHITPSNAPDDPSININVSTPGGGTNVGDGTFGDDQYEQIVVDGTPQFQDPEGVKKFRYLADTCEEGSIGFLIAANKSREASCEIDGPLAPRPAGPLASIECLSINPRLTMRVERGPDGCEVDAYAVQFWLDNPTCTTGVGTLLTTTVTTSTDLICAGLDDQGCPECITGSGGTSPTYYEYTTATGLKVTVCYDLANPPSYACP